MMRRLNFNGPREVAFEDVAEAELKSGEVRLQTLYSGISAGTQLTAYRGTNPFVGKTYDPDLRLFTPREDNTSLYPVSGGWAYEEVGVVEEIGPDVHTIQVGDIVYGAWGHSSAAVVTEQFALDHKLPSDMDPLCGIYSQMGAIALNAILDADIHVGETVAVFGQGVPGQLVSQLARLNGGTVIAIDLDPYRLEKSTAFGAHHTLNSSEGDISAAIRQLTGGRGADVAIEISGASPALHEAIRSVAYNGKVVTAGFYQGGAKDVYLGEEFHHNRVQLICSQIGGVAPWLNRRWDRIRMEQTIMQLAKSGALKLAELVTHQFNFEQAADAYRMLDENKEPVLQSVLKFNH
ncbi:hypothetical protein SY83_07840 [Paenibacillus swuensis]|uniref:Enoyl reductase (ER) domain-containing protein n=1 Tax=Paenibacillus swuensis TaxID=1178515 RepID=A0A172TH53_9BACL|nr:zinc-binding dehydrogenase [Paenibacillus swuensis]ANE46197.1 hypothetical protein SY83_07840 [Paenibacillus swuensis]